MGLDATVRCRCFEDGRLRPGPVPFGDLYIDADGYLASKRLDKARSRFSYRQYLARYGQLEDEFDEWLCTCCEHEDTEYCAEWIGNWAGCAQFEDLVEELGGSQRYPILSNILPRGNDGLFPADKAPEALKELDRFISEVSHVEEWVLRERETDKPIWASTDKSTFTWMAGPFEEIGMRGSKVFFRRAGFPCVETTQFKQIPIGKPSGDGSQRMRIVCLDSNETTEAFDSIGPLDAPKVEREFYVSRDTAPFLFEGKYGTAERLKRVLLASVETGNPMRWC